MAPHPTLDPLPPALRFAPAGATKTASVCDQLGTALYRSMIIRNSNSATRSRFRDMRIQVVARWENFQEFRNSQASTKKEFPTSLVVPQDALHGTILTNREVSSFSCFLVMGRGTVFLKRLRPQKWHMKTLSRNRPTESASISIGNEDAQPRPKVG